MACHADEVTNQDPRPSESLNNEELLRRARVFSFSDLATTLDARLNDPHSFEDLVEQQVTRQPLDPKDLPRAISAARSVNRSILKPLEQGY